MMRETKLGKLQRKRNILPIEANINKPGKKGVRTNRSAENFICFDYEEFIKKYTLASVASVLSNFENLSRQPHIKKGRKQAGGCVFGDGINKIRKIEFALFHYAPVLSSTLRYIKLCGKFNINTLKLSQTTQRGRCILCADSLSRNCI